MAFWGRRAALTTLATTLAAGCSPPTASSGDAGFGDASHKAVQTGKDASPSDANFDVSGNTKADATLYDATRGAPDSGTERVDAEGGTSDTSTLPVGFYLNQGASLLYGLTDNDFAIYGDMMGGLWATTISDAMPTLIIDEPDGGTQYSSVRIDHNVVSFIVEDPATPESRTLELWNQSSITMTTIALATHSTGVLAVSIDSSYLVFTDNVQANDGGLFVGDLVVSTGLGLNPRTLQSNVDIGSTNAFCVPTVAFDVPYVIVSSCVAGGATTPTITSYDLSASPPSPIVVDTTAPGPSFVTDMSGTNILTVEAAPPFGLTISALNGGTPVNVFGSVGMAPNLYLSKLSSFALYSESVGGLGMATFASAAQPDPVLSTIVSPDDGGAHAVVGSFSVSPDEQSLVYGTGVGTTFNLPMSLYLNPLPFTGEGVPLLRDAGTPILTSGPYFTFGGAFTVNSNYLLFQNDLQAVAGAGNSTFTGNLESFDLHTGNVNSLVSTRTVRSVIAVGTQSNIIYAQNFVLDNGNPNGGARVDLYKTDASMAGAGTLIVTGADALYYVTSDGQKLVYSYTHGGSADGIYTIQSQ